MRRVIEVMHTLAGVLAVALLLCGCATSHPLIAGPSQTHDLGPGESIVFGSVRVEIAPGGERLGRRAADFNYGLTGCADAWVQPLSIKGLLGWRCLEPWELAVSPGEERTFVVRLATGYHDVGGLRAIRTWTFLGGEFNIVGSYRTTPGEVTYIGRLVLVLPERLTGFSEAAVRVENGLATAQAALGGGYGERFESPRVELIKPYSNQAQFTMNPAPAPPPVP